MTGLKVADLYADLGLDDHLTKAVDKAGVNFKSAAKDMDGKGRLDLDKTDLDRKLKDAEADAEATTKKISKQAPKVDGSKIPEGIKKGMEGADEAVQAGMGPLGDVLAGGLAGIGVAGGAALYEAFGATISRQKGNNKLAIQLGLTPEMAKAAGDSSARIYAQGFGESLGDTNDAIRFVAQNIGGLGSMSQDEFDDMTKGVLTLADSFDQDLNKVTAAAGTLMKTGLAKNGREALDIITRGLQSPANKADDLLDTFIEYSTQFRQLGLSGPQALGLLSQGLQGGARDADTVADALKEFAIRAQDGSTTSATAFATIGVNAADMSRIMAQGGPPAQNALTLTMQKIAAIEDPALRSQTAVALFGTKAEDLQGALGSLNTQTAVDQVGAVDGAMQTANNSTSTAASGFENWKRSMELNVTSFIDQSVIPALGRLADKYHEFFGDDSGENLRRGAAILNGTADGGKGNWWSDWGANAVISATPVGSLAKGIFGFDTGGVVPGPIGAPQLAMVHGGETILPTHKPAASSSSASMRGRAGGRTRETTIIRFGTAEVARQERIHDKAWS